MNKKILSFGYDTERPYGDLASTPKGIEFRKKQVGFIRELNHMFNDYNCPRTHFILGHYLEKCLDSFNQDYMRSIFDKNNKLMDIQQHSYSHPTIRKIEGRDDKIPFTAQEFSKDVIRASDTIETILGVRPYGIRTPLGYPHDLSDIPEVALELKNAGIKYVSSDLRSSNNNPKEMLNAPLTKERQPHNYRNIGLRELVEVPSHGLQDVVFTQEMAPKFVGSVWPENKIFDHYNNLLSQAEQVDAPIVSVALCFHPWAVLEYDKNLSIHRGIISSARNKGFEIKSYSQVAELYR